MRSSNFSRRFVVPWVTVLSPGLAWAEPVVETLDHAQIDWTEGFVLATGSGAPNLELSNVAQARIAAERAAKLDAYRHVLEALGGVRVTASAKADIGAPEVKAQVEGSLKRCRVKDTRYFSDGGVDVVLQCPLDGGLATALAPTGPRSAPLGGGGGESRYTGLVLDASGVAAQPALLPTVSGTNGEPLLDARTFSAEALLRQGGAVYVTRLEDAKAHPRVGASPVVLGVSQNDPKRGWLVADAELEKLRGADLGFLEEGRVVVVLAAEEPR